LLANRATVKVLDSARVSWGAFAIVSREICSEVLGLGYGLRVIHLVP